MSKPIPTLADWIGDGARADGFEEWVETTVALQSSGLDDDRAAMLRMVKTFAIAATEAGRIETASGRDFTKTILQMPRAAGVGVGSAIISVCDKVDGRLIKLITDEFRAGVAHVAKGART